MAERPPDCGRTGARRDRLGTATERTGPAHARAGRFQASRRNYRERAALTSHPRIAGAVHAITGREPDGERGVRGEPRFGLFGGRRKPRTCVRGCIDLRTADAHADGTVVARLLVGTLTDGASPAAPLSPARS